MREKDSWKRGENDINVASYLYIYIAGRMSQHREKGRKGEGKLPEKGYYSMERE